MEAKKINNSNDKVVVKKIIKASREDVFDAWTKPEIMNQWFVGAKGSAKTSADLRIGGKYANEMLIDCVTNPGKVNSYMHSGEYLEIVKPERLVFTWNSHAVKNTKVTVSLREVSEGTEVTITHELLPESEFESHTGGWTHALSKLSDII